MSEGMGAFVDIDQTKLSRDGLVLLGMKMALDGCVQDLHQGSHAQTNEVMAQAFMAVTAKWAERRDSVAVALTKSASKSGAGVINSIRRD